jgi:hypothetical protein
MKYGRWWQFWLPVEWGAEQGKRHGLMLGVALGLGLLLLFAATARAQDAVVVPVAKEDAQQLAQKYAAFGKAQAEWIAAKDAVDAKVKGDKSAWFYCGVTYSKDFTAAVPAKCQDYKPTYWNGGLVTPAIALSSPFVN